MKTEPVKVVFLPVQGKPVTEDEVAEVLGALHPGDPVPRVLRYILQKQLAQLLGSSSGGGLTADDRAVADGGQAVVTALEQEIFGRMGDANARRKPG